RPRMGVAFPEIAGGDHAGEKPASEQRHARDVETPARRPRRGAVARDIEKRQDDGGEADRDVDVKYPPPRPVRHEQPAEYRPDHRPDRKDTAEQSKRPVALLAEMIDHD